MALSEKLQIVIEAVGGDAVVRTFNRLAGAAEDASDATRDVSQGANQSASAFDRLGSAVGVSGDAIKGGLAAAATAAVGFGLQAVTAFKDATQEVLTFQRATGTTAEKASQIVAALDDMGISAETGGKAFFTLAQNVAANGAKLAEFGIGVARSKDGNVDLAETLLSVADAYNATTDPAERAVLLSTTFGKAGKELIPILEQGREGIEELYSGAEGAGLLFSQEDLQKGEDLRVAIDGLLDSVGKFSMEAGRILIPVLTSAAETIAALSNAVSDAGEKSGSALSKVFGAIPAGIRDFDLLGTRLGDLFDITEIGTPFAGITGGSEDAGEAAADAASEFELLGGTIDEASSSAEDATAPLDKLRNALFSTEAAERSAARAAKDQADAEGRLGDARRKLNDLLARGAVDAKAVAAATQDVTAAQRSLEKASQDVADAQRKVIDVNRELDDLLSGRAAADAAAEAGDDLAAAQLRLRRAQNQSLAAQERLTELQDAGTSTTLELSNAQIDVEQSALDVKEATDSLAQAERDLSVAQKIGAENSQETINKRGELVVANNNLKVAEDGVAAATQAAADKQAALMAAMAGDPAFQDDVARARQAVATATDAVATATFNASQQAFAAKGKAEELGVALNADVVSADSLRAKLVEMAKDPALATFLAGPIAQLDTFRRKLNESVGVNNPLAGPGYGLRRFETPSLPAKGDPTLGWAPVTIHVAGSVLSTDNLIDEVVRGIAERQKRGAPLGLVGVG